MMGIAALHPSYELPPNLAARQLRASASTQRATGRQRKASSTG